MAWAVWLSWGWGCSAAVPGCWGAHHAVPGLQGERRGVCRGTASSVSLIKMSKLEIYFPGDRHLSNLTFHSLLSSWDVQPKPPRACFCSEVLDGALLKSC